MTDTLWAQTVLQQPEQETAGARADSGCLLQIHPLQIDNGLIALDVPSFAVGRDPEAGMCVPHASISRRHALIQKTSAGFVVVDQGSTNGTWVNEQRVQSQLLVPGDRLRFGSVIFKFLSSTHIEAHYHEAVYSMMTRDSLTGVWNKRYFLEVLEREMKRDLRHGRTTSLIIFDIDHFKSINDTYGHLAGDEVLRDLGQRMGTVLREDEVLARYGGEEFAVVLSEVGKDSAAETGERCRSAVEEQPFATSAGNLQVTISVGVAETVPSHVDEPASLIEHADRRLYEAKRSGRNRVCS